MTVKTGKGIWVVPPLLAVWIPANTLHEIEVSGHLSMRTLYIDPQSFLGPSTECCVIAVTPLLKELVLHAVTIPQPYPLGGAEERLLNVMLDQISGVNITALELPMPEDPRLKKSTTI